MQLLPIVVVCDNKTRVVQCWIDSEVVRVCKTNYTQDKSCTDLMRKHKSEALPVSAKNEN